MTSTAFTFPVEARLRKPRQFQTTFSQGHRLSTGLFRLHVRLSDLQQRPEAGGQQETIAAQTMVRLGISVSKRTAANAVVRNRIKRAARESFRHTRMQLPRGDYVLLAQRGAAGATPQALREALARLWQCAIALKQASATPTMSARAGVNGEPL